MTNETIDYEQLVKAKYPDAVCDIFNGEYGVNYYRIRIKKINYHSMPIASNFYVWYNVYNELKQKNLL